MTTESQELCCCLRSVFQLKVITLKNWVSAAPVSVAVGCWCLSFCLPVTFFVTSFKVQLEPEMTVKMTRLDSLVGWFASQVRREYYIAHFPRFSAQGLKALQKRWLSFIISIFQTWKLGKMSCERRCSKPVSELELKARCLGPKLSIPAKGPRGRLFS